MTQLLARDLDNDPLVFGVVGEEASRFFAVESVTGVVWLRQPLDREVTALPGVLPIRLHAIQKSRHRKPSERSGREGGASFCTYRGK